MCPCVVSTQSRGISIKGKNVAKELLAKGCHAAPTCTFVARLTRLRVDTMASNIFGCQETIYNQGRAGNFVPIVFFKCVSIYVVKAGTNPEQSRLTYTETV